MNPRNAQRKVARIRLFIQKMFGGVLFHFILSLERCFHVFFFGKNQNKIWKHKRSKKRFERALFFGFFLLLGLGDTSPEGRRSDGQAQRGLLNQSATGAGGTNGYTPLCPGGA